MAQGLVKVLPVDVQQHLSEVLEALQWHGIAVDERTRASVGIDYAPEIAFVVEVQHLLLEPGPRAWQVSQVEFGGELSALRTAARKPGTATLPQHQAQRIDQDRFSGTGLTSQDRHAAVKFDLGLINDGEISDLQTDEHGSVASKVPGAAVPAPVKF